MSKISPFPPLSITYLERFVLVPLEERVHPIPFRTRQLSSPSSMILHILMWESRTVPRRYFEAHQSGGLLFFCLSPFQHLPFPPLPLIPEPFPSLLPSPVSTFLQGRVSSLLICLSFFFSLSSRFMRIAHAILSLFVRSLPPLMSCLRYPESDIRDGDTGIGTV